MSSFVNATAKADLGAIVDELILGGMKVSHKNLVMHMAIGSIVTCFLTGIVIMQVIRYADICQRDPKLLRWLAFGLTFLTIAQTGMNLANNVKAIEYWGDFAHWFRPDMYFRGTQEGLLVLIHGPAALIYFGLKAWGLNDRSKILACLLILGLVAYMAAGLTIVYFCFNNPVKIYDDPMKSLTFAFSNAKLINDWLNNIILGFRIWSCVSLAILVSLVSLLVFSFIKNRTGKVKYDKPLNRLRDLQIECLLPVTIAVIAHPAIVMIKVGWGGWMRPLADIVPALYTHAVVHALNSRQAIEKMFEDMSSTLGDNETWSHDFSLYNDESKSDVDLTRASNFRRQFQAFKLYAVWEQPLSNRFTVGNEPITLGSREIALELDDFVI